jgi:hypothetical protein
MRSGAPANSRVLRGTESNMWSETSTFDEQALLTLTTQAEPGYLAGPRLAFNHGSREGTSGGTRMSNLPPTIKSMQQPEGSFASMLLVQDARTVSGHQIGVGDIVSATTLNTTGTGQVRVSSPVKNLGTNIPNFMQLEFGLIHSLGQLNGKMYCSFQLFLR